jgi:hypothetical protein
VPVAVGRHSDRRMAKVILDLLHVPAIRYEQCGAVAHPRRR